MKKRKCVDSSLAFAPVFVLLGLWLVGHAIAQGQPANAPPNSAPGSKAPPTTAPSTESSPIPAETDPKWLERLPKDDRAAIEENLGYAPPDFTKDIKWLGSEETNWNNLRGKVVVIQSWTTGNTAARTWPTRVGSALKDFQLKDLRIIALHTPENADNAEEFLKRQKPPENVMVAIDPVGAFCDALGIFKHPVNLVVDRNGVLRYAGLNINGLRQAVTALVAEPFDRNKTAPQKPKDEESESTGKGPQYPSTKTGAGGATDIRGKRAPEFFVESWYTREPNPSGKVVMITFWSIDNGESLSVHPHLNEIAKHFGKDLCSVAIAQDTRSNFDEATLEKHMSRNDFEYAVALDRSHKMADAMNVRNIPYTIVMSRDWIVRWQGRPEQLKPQVIEQIIKADAAAASSPNSQPDRGGKRRGWTSGN